MKISCQLGPVAILCVTLGFSCSAAISPSQIEDLEFAKRNYVLKSKAFSSGNRREALAFINNLEAQSEAFSKEKFLVSLLQIAAFARNAHDSLRFGQADAWRPQNKLPFRIIWFPDAMIIARAGPEYGELLGASVTRIEGLSIDEVLVRLRKTSGGPDGYLRWNTVWLIENAGLLRGLGVAQAPDRLRFSLVLRDGRHVEREISFLPQASMPERLGPVRL